MPRLFLSQDWVNQANVEDKVTVAGQTLTVPSDGKTYHIEPAVHFLRVDGGADTHQLVGTVKTETQLRAINGELDRNAVIVNDDVAYTVEPGYAATFSGVGDPISAIFR